MKTVIQRFHAAYVLSSSGCWLWNRSKTQKGYGWFKFNGGNKQAHRAAYEILVGEIPEGLNVLHKCDTPSCVNPEHLFLGTQQENVQDMIKKGRHRWANKGEKHPKFKITDEQVQKIRTSNKSQKKLADEFGVSQPTISQIKNFKTRI